MFRLELIKHTSGISGIRGEKRQHFCSEGKEEYGEAANPGFNEPSQFNALERRLSKISHILGWLWALNKLKMFAFEKNSVF